MVATKIFSLLAKETGIAVKSFSREFSRAVPKNAVTCDRILVGKNGKTEADFLLEAFTYKDKDGKVLKRITKKVEEGDVFLSKRTYQHNYIDVFENGLNYSRYSYTYNYKNGSIASAQQESIARSIAEESNKTKITRVKIDKQFTQDGSRDTHFIGEFANKTDAKKFEFGFNRDKKGFVSSAVEKLQEILPNGTTISTKNPYLVTNLNTNKSDVAKDLLAIKCNQLHFGKKPKIKITGLEKNNFATASYWRLSSDVHNPIDFIDQKIELSRMSPKAFLSSEIAHEMQHFVQLRRFLLSPQVQNEFRIRNDIAEFYTMGTPLNNRFLSKSEQKLPFMRKAGRQFLEFLKEWGNNVDHARGKISTDSHFKTYQNLSIEREARIKGAKEETQYQNQLRKLSKAFPQADWAKIIFGKWQF